jgi:nitroimidazol reductase NimA-like FMN-containing flavoprotein (pyridoxamine 5'-phosphate oxidase superfamily)
MEIDRNGLEVLDRDECLRLLATATLGRIGLTSQSLPTVLPVNFILEGERDGLRAPRRASGAP